MSRSDSSREVSVTTSSESRSSGRSPVRSTSVAAVRRDQASVAIATLMPAPPAGRGRAPRAARGSAARSPRARAPRCRCASSGIARLLVRIVDAGEALDLALERLLVETLDVAPRALLDRRRRRAPRRTCPTPRPARAPSAASPRTARSRRRSRRRRWRVSREATQPMRSMFVSRSSFEKPRPFERCVRTVSPSRYSTTWPRCSSSGPTRCAIVVLPGAGESGEPEREAALAAASDSGCSCA